MSKALHEGCTESSRRAGEQPESTIAATALRLKPPLTCMNTHYGEQESRNGRSLREKNAHPPRALRAHVHVCDRTRDLALLLSVTLENTS